MITRDELIAWAARNGWQLDRFGHLKKQAGKDLYRLKLSRIAARYEIQSPTGWIRLRSGYLKQLTITADDKLGGLTR